MVGQFQTLREFIADFRSRVGDTTQEIPESHLITTTNLGLRRLAREGLG